VCKNKGKKTISILKGNSYSQLHLSFSLIQLHPLVADDTHLHYAFIMEIQN